ncbi:MAG: hypothetical protein HRU20_29085 [Pseudomonadales bacterium]|nr:hypothetical protein [Pseudomonadales bacterium]
MDKTATNNQQHTNTDWLNCDSLHQACFIDNDGIEIPITRAMIDHSCDVLTHNASTSQHQNRVQ